MKTLLVSINASYSHTSLSVRALYNYVLKEGKAFPCAKAKPEESVSSLATPSNGPQTPARNARFLNCLSKQNWQKRCVRFILWGCRCPVPCKAFRCRFYGRDQNHRGCQFCCSIVTASCRKNFGRQDKSFVDSLHNDKQRIFPLQ